MDELMEQIRFAWRQFKAKEITLFAATAVTNAAAAVIKNLACALQLDYPHIKDLDTIMATIHFQPEIRLIMQRHPRISYHTAMNITIMSQELMVERKIPEIISKVSRLVRVNEREAENLLSMCLKGVMLKGIRFLSWSETLGGENSINDTHTMLKKIIDVYNPKMFLVAKDGFFGPAWHEKTNLAGGTRHLTQDFLSAKFLPLALVSFKGGAFRMQHEDEIMPMTCMVREYAKRREVSLWFAFSVHAMLLAFFTVQGNMDCTRLAIESRKCVCMKNELFRIYI
jgi:hypothetical protein